MKRANKTDLLPLPKWMSNYTIPPDSSVFDNDVKLADRMRDYARANIAHATATLQAERESLWAEVENWKESFCQAASRAERLEKTLGELYAALANLTATLAKELTND